MKPRINKLARGVRVTLSVAAGAIAFYLACMDKGTPEAAIPFIWLFIWLSLVVHELGHAAGARLYGMTVLRMNISGLEFHMQRRGWRMRQSRIPHRHIGGFVQAIPLFGQPARPQLISLTLGGPLGNLVMTLLCGIGGWLLLPRHTASLALSFAAVNLGSALVNLVPYQGAMASDGLTLLRLLRGLEENAPSRVHMRLISRSFAGQTADQLPEDEVALLERQPAPMPLVALWYRLKADQNRGHWASVDSRRIAFDAQEQAMTPAQKTAISDLLVILRTEFAFSRAMLTGDSAELAKDTIPAKLAWSLPWLQPRCQALIAALQGDSKRCTELLETSRRKAENSIDKAVWSSESLLRTYIAAVDESSHRHQESALLPHALSEPAT
ncbi:M50 family metallopeptidase [Dyella sp. GSA-30]|uniref:M50 family metallopeptidase n=1 Tax=Dyella sp. GSA-30 TaxID=2994496 RepID=UPI002490068F|nr:M50 family metallopeptidase [Dyella sp. GSA-30]BDU22457.1 hypothetical protein DYGSA30_39140 [Dyella sp. GSA-30]